jgi:5'-deoxynucleotidase YfbR-like HD superfamily hydrolase
MSEHDRSHDRDLPQVVPDLLALSHCVRWSVIPVSRAQTVADHSYRVMVIVTELLLRIGLTGEFWEGPVLHWAMVHDGDESRTGDIQSSFKRIIDEVEQAVTNDAGARTVLPVAYQRTCPWYWKIREHIDSTTFGPLIFGLVKLADRIEMATWLTKYGVGPHAEFVCGKMKALITNECNSLATTVNRLRDDIQLDDASN